RSQPMVQLDATTVTDARRELARRSIEAANRPAEPALGDGTVAALAAAFLAHKAATVKPATLAAYQRAWKRDVGPGLGHLLLADLSRERAARGPAARRRAAPTHRRSIEHAVDMLGAMCALAVEWGRLPANPAARVRLPPPPPKPDAPVLDAEQAARLL